jgi:hypothetical protein
VRLADPHLASVASPVLVPQAEEGEGFEPWALTLLEEEPTLPRTAESTRTLIQ